MLGGGTIPISLVFPRANMLSGTSNGGTLARGRNRVFKLARGGEGGLGNNNRQKIRTTGRAVVSNSGTLQVGGSSGLQAAYQKPASGRRTPGGSRRKGGYKTKLGAVGKGVGSPNSSSSVNNNRKRFGETSRANGNSSHRPRPRPTRLIGSPISGQQQLVNTFRDGMNTAPNPSSGKSKSKIRESAVQRPSSRPLSRGSSRAKPRLQGGANASPADGANQEEEVNRDEIRSFLQSWNAIGKQPPQQPSGRRNGGGHRRKQGGGLQVDDMLVISMSPIHLKGSKSDDVSRLGDFETLPRAANALPGIDVSDHPMAGLFAGGGGGGMLGENSNSGGNADVVRDGSRYSKSTQHSNPNGLAVNNISFPQEQQPGGAHARPSSRGRFRAQRGLPYGIPSNYNRRARTSVPRSRRKQKDGNLQLAGLKARPGRRARPSTRG